MPIVTTSPDPSWAESVAQREAILWLGESTPVDEEAVQRLIALPWRAVYLDGAPGVDAARVREIEVGSLRPRFYSEDAGPETVPPNRLPFYDLRGPSGEVTWDSDEDPVGLMRRMTMLRRPAAARWVICVGVEADRDWLALRNAQQLSDAFRNLIVISPSGDWDDRLDATTESSILWAVDVAALAAAFSELGERQPGALSVAVRGPGGQLQAIDLSGAIDRSSPIEEDFEVIPASISLQTVQPTEGLLKTLVEDPTRSWEPYAADVAFPRWHDHAQRLLPLLQSFRDDGPGASLTTWLDAEPASGATTALRHLGLACARQGFPVLVARSTTRSVDFSRLKAFLQAGSDRLAEAGISVPELPWVILFDAEHVQTQWETVRGVASGLRKLQRSVVVIAVRPSDTKPSESEYRALGRNADLGPLLTNSVSDDEVTALSEHFASLLPARLARTRTEWAGFLEQSVRTTPDGRKSLFWLALRFWLFRLPGSGESIRAWIARHMEVVVDDSADIRAGLLELAALARYRLATPAELLNPEASRALRRVAWDRSNPLGITAVDYDHGDAVTLAHPLIGEELLRLATERPEFLDAVGKQSCLGLMDLELHLLGRVMSRPSIASPVGLRVAESLVTSGLRVDQREAPRNYHVRDRIVELLESAPDSLWDQSQVFNHHLARARRHLAIDPPSSAWGEEARREQFALSEYHLLDAIEHVRPEDPEREESPLNLQVSLALTLDYRARFEREHGTEDSAQTFRERADAAFAAAQSLDSDNSYVLENYARFKLREAEQLPAGESRLRLCVEALALLEFELDALGSTNRDETILSEMARAFELLERGEGHAMLRERADRGEEAAVVALAKLALFHSEDEDRMARLREARELLESLPFDSRGWLSDVMLYRVKSELDPLDFPGRLEILQALDHHHDFKWPLQLRLEYGILLFQAGDEQTRREGRDVFAEVREAMGSSSASIAVPAEMKFLADPASGFTKPLETSIRIRNVSGMGRTIWAVPEGWYNLSVPLRPFMFAGELRVQDERDCIIQFTNFGPMAVPPTTLT